MKVPRHDKELAATDLCGCSRCSRSILPKLAQPWWIHLIGEAKGRVVRKQDAETVKQANKAAKRIRELRRSKKGYRALTLSILTTQ